MLISSHGNETGLICSDKEIISSREIIEIFSGKQSRIKIETPKLFFIQACRGAEDDEGKVATQNIYGHLTADSGTKMLQSDTNILVAYSTTEKKKAYSYAMYPLQRIKEKTFSWFISCLLSIFKEYSEREDLLTMLTRVNKAMCLYGDEYKKKQISSQENRLTYKIYFTKRH